MSLIKTKSIQLGWDLTPTNNFTIYQPATPDGTFRIATGNAGSTTDIMTVSSTGSVTYAGTVSYSGLGFGTGSATAPSIFPNGDTNTGMYFPTAETIGFSTNGTERVRISSTGQVGIGKTPTTELDVNGNAAVSGAITATSINTLNTFGFKNKVINGAMMVDQRNGGSSVTVNNYGHYSVDRYALTSTNAGSPAGGVYTAQQSTTAPAGFTNSLSITVSTADASPAAGDTYRIQQGIEGYNVADLGWGTPNASTITLSFWVRSSLTGTFAGGIVNGSADRSYVFTYTINSANTWEYKTITISGDQNGIWNKTNGAGIYLEFDLGSGSAAHGTANAWQSGFCYATSSSTKLIATNGATFYITGIQLEKGSVATSFDWRSYNVEDFLCKRYYERLLASYSFSLHNPNGSYLVQAVGTWHFSVTKRTAPTVGYISGVAINYDRFGIGTINPSGTNFANSLTTSVNINPYFSSNLNQGERISMTSTLVEANAEL